LVNSPASIYLKLNFINESKFRFQGFQRVFPHVVGNRQPFAVQVELSLVRIYKVEGSHNDEEMRVIWNSLGLYVSRNLRMGRGVNIPRLGVFTFTPPEVRLKGVTN
jgi:CCDC81 eukaryotic HU domain 1